MYVCMYVHLLILCICVFVLMPAVFFHHTPENSKFRERLADNIQNSKTTTFVPEDGDKKLRNVASTAKIEHRIPAQRDKCYTETPCTNIR